MAVYNFGDLFGRILSMVKAFWPSRRVVVIGSCVRVIFIPILILCAKGIIPTQMAGYVLTAILALTNGYFGTLTMVYTPLSSGLITDGERALAGQCTGVCLLIGCSIGVLLQLAVVLVL
uniref:Equilibrative nucleoside transporter 4 n=1 Tax=Lygus hesperus TaxID=30085 RepID=A0A0A9Y2G4_LYGHE